MKVSLHINLTLKIQIWHKSENLESEDETFMKRDPIAKGERNDSLGNPLLSIEN